MNDTEALLVELRKISSSVDAHRRMTTAILIGLIVFVSVIVGIWVRSELMMKEVTAEYKPIDFEAEVKWHNVDSNVNKGNLQDAIRIGSELIKKTPLFPDGHFRLANAYLASGDIRKAQEHSREAFRLLPSEKNKDLLDAINKRIEQEKP